MLYTYRFYIKRGKKLKSAILRYRTVASEETSEAKTSWLTNIQCISRELSWLLWCYDQILWLGYHLISMRKLWLNLEWICQWWGM